MSFAYRYQNGSGGFTQTGSTTSVDPDNYDDGSGTLASVASNRYTIHRIYYFGATDDTFLMYGQNLYATLADAEGSIFSEVFNADPNLARDAALRGWLIVRGGTTDLTDTTRAKFIEADKFGTSATGGSTSSTTTLQQAYNNSTPNPEILTDATNGAVTLRRGSAADTDNVLEIQN